MRDDPALPLIFTREEALAAGLSRHQIAHRVRNRCWRPLRRAVYIHERRYAALAVREQHAAALIATLMARPDHGVNTRLSEAPDEAVTGQLVASHLSAALAFGWVLPLGGAGPVTLTDGNFGAPTRRTKSLTVQVASLPATDIGTRSVEIAGSRWEIDTTSRARTVADNLRHLANADGVSLADSALRRGKVSYKQITAVLRRQSRWPYADNAFRALPMVDPRRESWLESYSFVRLHQLGLAMPEPQVTLFDGQGRFVGRVDGWLEEEAVALESDGREKYLLGSQALPADVDLAGDELLNRAHRRIYQEKERRDRIVDLGAELARWGTREILRSPGIVLSRVVAAQRRGGAGRFTGRTAYLPVPAWLLPSRLRDG